MTSPDEHLARLRTECERLAAAGQRDAARADAAELELERAHRLLDEYGVPREQRAPGARDAVEYSLLGRLRLLLDEDDGEPRA